MKEIEITTTEVSVTEEADKTTVEIVDTTLEAALDRRHHAIMARTIRMRVSYEQKETTLSNSHRITF